MYSQTKQIALSGLLAALAVTIQCLGGMIPVATYIVPMLCCILQDVELACCGKRFAWTWYAAVSVLSLLLGPDKEAALFFLLLGYYPIIKPALEKTKLHFLWKALLFNTNIALLYGLLLKFLGLDAVEDTMLGIVELLVMLLLGNTVFFLLDRMLTMLYRKRHKK